MGVYVCARVRVKAFGYLKEKEKRHCRKASEAAYLARQRDTLSRRHRPRMAGDCRKASMTKSVAAALDMARSALYTQQSELLREIRSLQETMDRNEKNGQAADAYLTESMADRKVKLAETMVARETLYYLD